LLFTRRYETQIICPVTGGLNHLRETGGHWKERAIPPMAVLGEQYPIRWSHVNLTLQRNRGLEVLCSSHSIAFEAEATCSDAAH